MSEACVHGLTERGELVYPQQLCVLIVLLVVFCELSECVLLFQAEKQSLEQTLQTTEDNLSRQLTYAQQVSLLCPLTFIPRLLLCTIKDMSSIFTQ